MLADRDMMELAARHTDHMRRTRPRAEGFESMARLITKTGRRAEMVCDMSNERSGKLICNPSTLALADLQGDLMLETDDGGRCHIRITSIGADHLTFAGRVIERV